MRTIGKPDLDPFSTTTGPLRRRPFSLDGDRSVRYRVGDRTVPIGREPSVLPPGGAPMGEAVRANRQRT
ncbi:hypothetical protein BRD01_08470 [Halobacteriales archaeon QS_8_65_32]|jgi:hypothetical protein|nr:MAG: hypothetical protein BRD01_08470 [Halobacteriales archaeon QS_8_65_32]